MTDLPALIVPILLLIGTGFVAARVGIASREHIEGLAVFVLNFALPALVLNALSRQDIRQTFNWNYVAAYGAGSLMAFFAALLVLRIALGKPLTCAAIGGLGGATSNTGFIGFPVASLALGAPALTALPLTMLVENILIIPLALALAEAGSQGRTSWRSAVAQTAGRLSRMPLIIAIALGAALSFLGLSLPGPVTSAVDMIAAASAPCALFAVGGIIAGIKAGGLTGDIAWIALAKLVLHPLAVAGFFLLIGGVPPELAATGILLAAVPMITVYPIFGERFGLGEKSAATLIVTTLAGLATITVVLGLLIGQR